MSEHGHEIPLSTPVGTRRRFFQWVIGGASALIGFGLGLPLIGYVVSPALKKRAQEWVDVGAVDQVSASEPRQFDHVTAIKDGWMESRSRKAVWAIKQADGSVTVYSPICPHLGCGYRWDDGDRKFKCPCHGSVYDINGQVLGGPAPRPLDHLPAKTENGRLLVIYKEFKAGLREQVEI
jgi:menaquinol-cytochrome c reductase iron-sulfur subunit